ncbi:hypothetical protein [Martelella alba]|nr:hypothetical protein [Martelella alba]
MSQEFIIAIANIGVALVIFNVARNYMKLHRNEAAAKERLGPAR